MSERTHDIERRVQEALRRDGALIQPGTDGLDRIRARIATGSAGRRRTWLITGAAGLATASAVAVALVVSGGLDGVGDPQPAEPTPAATIDGEMPSEQPTPSGTPKDPAPPRASVPVYYLGGTTTGVRLFREFHEVRTTDPALGALGEMFVDEPVDPDYSSPWADGSRALSVAHSGGLITVDLSAEAARADVPADTAQLMSQQLVYTVQGALQSTDPVRVLVEGEPAADLLGVPITSPMERADPLQVQALTWITSPAERATVDRTFTVDGIAAAFEAQVDWQLLRGSAVVQEGLAMTAEGQAFSAYSFTVSNVAPGTYTVRVFQASPEDGSRQFVDSKAVIVR
jgi:Immunoglobulin-like domain of bacterial spore germination/Sporulation and spore germination